MTSVQSFVVVTDDSGRAAEGRHFRIKHLGDAQL